MRAAKPTSVGYYTDSDCEVPAQMYTIPLWLDSAARTDIALPVLTTHRGNYVRREGEQHRPTGPRKKSDAHSPGEVMESKTKLLDQMRHVLRLKHLSIRTEKA